MDDKNKSGVVVDGNELLKSVHKLYMITRDSQLVIVEYIGKIMDEMEKIQEANSGVESQLDLMIKELKK